MLAVEVLLANARVTEVEVGAVKALVADAANALRAPIAPCTVDNRRGTGTKRRRTSGRRAILIEWNDVRHDPSWELKMEHLMVGLVVKNLNASIMASIAQVEIFARGAFVAGPNDRRIASVAGRRMDRG